MHGAPVRHDFGDPSFYFETCARTPGAQACHALASPHTRFAATPSLCWTVAAALPPSPVPLFVSHASHVCLYVQEVSAWQVNESSRQVAVRCQKKTRRREAI